MVAFLGMVTNSALMSTSMCNFAVCAATRIKQVEQKPNKNEEETDRDTTVKSSFKKEPRTKIGPSTGTLFANPIKWGGRSHLGVLADTCTIDNQLAIFHSVAAEHPGFISGLSDSKDAAESTLGTVLLHLAEREVNKAKSCWVDFLLSRGAVLTDEFGEINLFGGLFERFFGFFNAALKLTFTSVCSKGPELCPNYRFRDCSYAPIELKPALGAMRNDAQSQIDHIFGDAYAVSCSNIVLPENYQSLSVFRENSRPCDVVEEDLKTTSIGFCCGGSRTWLDVSLDADCWLLPLNVERLPHSDIFLLPDVLIVDGRQFILRGVIIHSRYPSHFTAYIRRGGYWYYYDGRAEPCGRKIAKPLTSGKPQLAVYCLRPE